MEKREQRALLLMSSVHDYDNRDNMGVRLSVCLSVFFVFVLWHDKCRANYCYVLKVAYGLTKHMYWEEKEAVLWPVIPHTWKWFSLSSGTLLSTCGLWCTHYCNVSQMLIKLIKLLFKNLFLWFYYVVTVLPSSWGEKNPKITCLLQVLSHLP